MFVCLLVCLFVCAGVSRVTIERVLERRVMGGEEAASIRPRPLSPGV